jgi:hemoglobin
LGGKPAIGAVVDEFLSRVGGDERINGRFANADLPHLRTMLVEFICEASGGPCKYSGKDMRTAHAGMRLLDAEFDALVQNLKAALDHLKVPAAEQGQLLGALGPLRPQVVEGPSAPPVSGVPTKTAAGPVLDKAHALRQASSLLEKAEAARMRGSRSYAEQLFSGAELLVAPDALAELAPLFREGAPPRVTSPLKRVPADSPAQPATVGSSEEDQPDRKPPRRRALLAGSVVAANGRPLSTFAVVTLEPASGKSRRRHPKQRVIEQRNREFAPHVLAIPVGSSVTFPNFDSVYHNVFSRSASQPFDLGIYRGGQARELIFTKQGVVRIACNLHANMSAYIAVVSAPHYVIADATGRFTFHNLTPGRYRLRAFTEVTDEAVVQNVDLKASDNTVVVTVQRAGGASNTAAAGGGTTGSPGSGSLPTDKFGAPRGGAIHQ